MITKLHGLLDSYGDNWLALNVNNVFYHLFCSSKTLEHFSEVGQAYTLFTEMIVREDIMALYGFSEEQEREAFRLLTSVQGIGMKAALAILSVLTPSDLYVAIQNQTKELLTQAEGVGPKLAMRVINELKDKVTRLGMPVSLSKHMGSPTNIPTSQNQGSKMQILQEATSALTNLGYRPLEANQAVVFAHEHAHNGTVEEIIRIALNHLGKAKGSAL